MVTSYEVRGMRSIQPGMPIVYISYSTGAPFSARTFKCLWGPGFDSKE
jgi:hypothetical protein